MTVRMDALLVSPTKILTAATAIKRNWCKSGFRKSELGSGGFGDARLGEQSLIAS